MDMRINSALVKSERKKRAWSQQHLADATGLGLRTIQRIEASETASYESFHALASCLEIETSILRARNELATPTHATSSNRRKLIAGMLALFGAVVATLSMQGALAEQILLDLGVTKVQNSDTHELATQIKLDSGKSYELTANDAFRFNISATETANGQILIKVELFDYRDDEFVLLAEPSVLTADGEEATIQLGADNGQQGYFRILVTP